MRLRFPLGIAVLTAVLAFPAPAQAAVEPVTLAATISLSNCSASLVRFPSSADTDSAMMLTNGHCYERGFIDAGVVIQDVASTRTGTLLNSAGNSLGRVRANRVLYATMTGTDVTLYRLDSTYATLAASFGVTPLTIADTVPVAGTPVGIPSGYWREVWDCSIDGLVNTLREDEWTWTDSVRYDPGCDTIGGTSGSPIVSKDTGELIGINNTGNEDGGRCTLDNPCEVDENGQVTVLPGRGYGQETYWFTTCLTPERTIDLTIDGCLLPHSPSKS